MQNEATFFGFHRVLTVLEVSVCVWNCVMQDTDCSPAVGLGYLTVQWGTGHLHPHVSPDQAWFNPVLISGDPREKSWWIKCCRHCVCRWASRVVWELWLMRALEIRLLLSVGAQGTIPCACPALVSEAEMTLQLVCAWQLLSSKTIVLYPITS